MRILDYLREMLPEKSSVQMVADDPHMAAEIMLLVRMMFADGALVGVELDLFKNICQSVFEIPDEDVPEVITFLKEYGYETSGEQAAAEFQDMPYERKKSLLRQMISMAKADQILHEGELDLIARTAEVLGISPEQVQSEL